MPRRIFAAVVFALIAMAGISACRHETDTAPSRNARHTTASGDYGTPPADFDPVLVNGPIFEGWPDPELAIVITGVQQGYLEPCGCAGLHNQKGGLGRRHAMILQLIGADWPVVAVDVGDQIRRYGRQAEIKFARTVDALGTMDYDAAAFGPGELSLPSDSLLIAAEELQDGQSRFVSANVGLFGLDSGFTPRFRIIERAGRKIGVTAVLGDKYAATLAKDDLEIRPAHEALSEVVAELDAADCDVTILLAQATLEESRELARAFPQFDLVVSAGGADEPPAQPHEVEGSPARVIELGHKGMYAAVVGLYDDADEPMLFQRVPLDSRFEATDEMKTLLADYQTELRNLGFDGLGLLPVPHPRTSDGDDPLLGQFVGAAACGECHKKAYDKWVDTPHAHATETLAKLDPQRQFDPECLSCHATGWNPQEYFPYETGFLSLETTELLQGNGCENCHGPGAAHVAAERARGAERNLSAIERYRHQMRLTHATAGEQVCAKCHDMDNSPDFDKDVYWPKVAHPGKD